MKSKIFALCASFTLMLAGCGPEPVKATGVELDKTSATMIVGDTLQLNATVAPENATDKVVTWSASGDGIVSVEDGLVTALKAGQSTVTVTTHDGGFTATCAITVNNPVVHVTGVSLDVASKALVVGEAHQLVATVAPADATNKNVTWSVSGDAVTVNNGLVTAVQKGEATVTVKTADGNKTANCVFTVTNPPVASVTLDKDEAYLCVGETVQLTATVSPELAEDKTVAWSVTGSAATVSETGLVTAVALGESIVTVTTNDGSKTDTCTVTVVAYPEGTFMATVGTFNLTIALGNAKNGLVSVKASTKDMGASSILYNKKDGSFEIETTGKIAGAYSIGKISGKYDAVNDKLIEVNCDGDASELVANVELTRPSLIMRCEETTAQLQAMFKRRYMSGSWQVDNTNNDRFTSNTSEYVSGKASMKRRGYSGGAVAVNMASDFSPALTTKNIQYWVYNPSSNDITLRMWIYKGANLTSNAEIGSVVAKAGQWTYVAMGFGDQLGSASLYNIQIADFTNSGAYLSFDDITLF